MYVSWCTCRSHIDLWCWLLSPLFCSCLENLGIGTWFSKICNVVLQCLGESQYFTLFTVQVLASGIACFFLKAGLMKNLTAPAKVPLYALIGVSFAFTITYTFSEIVMLSPWDRYCGTNSQENPLFGSQQQVCLWLLTKLTTNRSLLCLLSLCCLAPLLASCLVLLM